MLEPIHMGGKGLRWGDLPRVTQKLRAVGDCAVVPPTGSQSALRVEPQQEETKIATGLVGGSVAKAGGVVLGGRSVSGNCGGREASWGGRNLSRLGSRGPWVVGKHFLRPPGQTVYLFMVKSSL